MKYPIAFEIEFLSNQYPGKFIAIEGIDGSGKTTQVGLVTAALKEKGLKAISTKEPTDEPTGKFIREILAGKIIVPPVALQYLFNADRAVHLEEIKKNLAEGYYIITDRYFWSSVAYGLSDLDVITDYYFAAFSMLSFYHRFLKPDKTFYLQLDPTTAMKRINTTQKEKEIYENKQKLEKITKGYDFLIAKFNPEFYIIDAEKTPDTITQEIVDQILKI